jgi:uncharacterized membrane protein YdjX (TVP38/TMEM64 family)
MSKYQFDAVTQERINHLMKKQRKPLRMIHVIAFFLVTFVYVPTYIILSGTSIVQGAVNIVAFVILGALFLGCIVIFIAVGITPIQFNKKVKHANFNTTAEGIVIKRYLITTSGGSTGGSSSSTYKYLLMVAGLEVPLHFFSSSRRNNYNVGDTLNVQYDSSNPDVARIV